VARAEAYFHAKLDFDPSNCLGTTHQRHRQTGQTDRQRTDSTGQTVLETVTQKWRIVVVMVVTFFLSHVYPQKPVTIVLVSYKSSLIRLEELAYIVANINKWSN